MGLIWAGIEGEDGGVGEWTSGEANSKCSMGLDA
jgi:hypothetical protein